jgi:hypothetical protein
MPDEVIALAQGLGEDGRLILEVDPLERRARRIAAPGQEHALEAIRELALCDPRHLGVADTPVDEDDPLHGCILTLSRSTPISRSGIGN